MKCFFYEDYQSCVSTATSSGYIIICDRATFTRRQVCQVPGEGDHYKQVKLQLSFAIIISTFHANFCVLVGLSVTCMSLTSAK